MSRSAVFLDEMGVGPLWRLRQGAAPEAVDVVVEAAVEMDVAGGRRPWPKPLKP